MYWIFSCSNVYWIEIALHISDAPTTWFLKSNKFVYKKFCDDIIKFLEFPVGCNTVNGPHPPLCLNSLWLEAGCLMQGSKAPDKLPIANMNFLNTMNIR